MSDEETRIINVSPQFRVLQLSRRELIEGLLKVLFTEPIAIISEDPGKYIYVKKDPFIISFIYIEERDDLSFLSNIFIIERGFAIDRERKLIYEVISMPRRGFWEIYVWSLLFNSSIEVLDKEDETGYLCVKCGRIYGDFEKMYKHFITRHKINTSTISGRSVVESITKILRVEKRFRDKEKSLNDIRLLDPRKIFN